MIGKKKININKNALKDSILYAFTLFAIIYFTIIIVNTAESRLMAGISSVIALTVIIGAAIIAGKESYAKKMLWESIIGFSIVIGASEILFRILYLILDSKNYSWLSHSYLAIDRKCMWGFFITALIIHVTFAVVIRCKNKSESSEIDNGSIIDPVPIIPESPPKLKPFDFENENLPAVVPLYNIGPDGKPIIRELPEDEPSESELPKDEPPKQELPKDKPPKQELPKDKPPKQELPKDKPPKQELPKVIAVTNVSDYLRLVNAGVVEYDRSTHLSLPL